MSLEQSQLASKLHAIQSYLDTDAIPWKRIIITLLCAVYLFKAYVMMRQYRMYSLTTPPKVLEGHVNHEYFLQCQQYRRDMAHSEFLEMFNEFVINLLMIVFNGDAHIWAASMELLRRLGVTPNELLTTAIYITFSTLVRILAPTITLANIEFVVGERYGFNTMKWPTFLAHVVKISGLNVMIFASLHAFSVFVVRWGGDSFVEYAALGFYLLRFVVSVIYPKLVKPVLYELTPLPEGQLRDRILALTSQLNFPLKDVYVADESQLTWNANGHFYDGVAPGGSKRIILSDTLLEQFSVPEIEVLLAQDLASWFYSQPNKMDVPVMLHLLLLLCMITLVFKNAALVFKNTALFRAFGFGGTNAVVRVPYLPFSVGFGFVHMFYGPIRPLYMFALSALTRHYEFRDDRYVFLTNAASPPHCPALA